MKTLLLLSSAAVALLLSSCADYYSHGPGYGRGYTASTVSIHAGGNRGFYPASHRNFGFVNPVRSFYPSRTVLLPSRSSFHHGHSRYQQRSYGHHRPVTQQVSHRGYGHRDQRPTAAPNHRDQRPVHRAPQRQERPRMEPSNRKAPSMTMASYRPSSSVNRTSRGSNSVQASARGGNRGSGNSSSVRDGRRR